MIPGEFQNFDVSNFCKTFKNIKNPFRQQIIFMHFNTSFFFTQLIFQSLLFALLFRKSQAKGSPLGQAQNILSTLNKQVW